MLNLDKLFIYLYRLLSRKKENGSAALETILLMTMTLCLNAGNIVAIMYVNEVRLYFETDIAVAFPLLSAVCAVYLSSRYLWRRRYLVLIDQNIAADNASLRKGEKLIILYIVASFISLIYSVYLMMQHNRSLLLQE